MADETLNTRPPLDLPPPPPKPEPAPAPARPAEPAPDTAPAKRPTTRAGRRAAAEARKAEKAAKATKPDTKPASKPAPRRASLETRLGGAIASLGTGVAVAGIGMGSEAVKADGLLVVEHSANVAKALDSLAKDNPAVAATLERMLTAGAWSGVIAACVPIAIGVASNHGMIPAGMAEALGAGQPDQPPA